jgi:hypothetical protein
MDKYHIYLDGVPYAGIDVDGDEPMDIGGEGFHQANQGAGDALRWGGEPGHIYSSQARRVVAELRHEQNDDAPRPDSELICGAVNALQPLIDHLRELQARDYEVVLLWLDMQMIHALDAVALGDFETAATHLNAAIERNRMTLESLRSRLASRLAPTEEATRADGT